MKFRTPAVSNELDQRKRVYCDLVRTLGTSDDDIPCFLISYCASEMCVYAHLYLLIISGYRSRGPGSIPGATKFSEK
jgi:hypothetical protein